LGKKAEDVEKKDGELETALEGQMLHHFQQEVVRLQNQNELLMQELQKMKDEREQRSKLAVPS
jgi:demethoxyubiquinone hydroxylase (CLK1/Coq7/Cat5 family)